MFDRKRAVGGELERISTVEVVMRPPEVFVRPLSHEEAMHCERCSAPNRKSLAAGPELGS
jgi:hypothetical protein